MIAKTTTKTKRKSADAGNGAATGRGHAADVAHGLDASPRKTKRAGQSPPVTQRRDARTETDGRAGVIMSPMPDMPGHDQTAGEGGHSGNVTHGADAPLDQAVAMIRELHRQRAAIIQSQVRITLQIKAFIRRVLGFYDIPREDTKARAKINADASAVFKAIEQNKPAEPRLTPHVEKLRQFVLVSLMGRKAFDDMRTHLEKQLIAAIRAMPVWTQWAVNVRGLGELSVATVLGEAGDLSLYAGPARLWKRLGMAPAACYQMTKKDGGTCILIPTKARCVVWNVGACLIKSGGDYKTLYDARKVYEHEKNTEMTDMHAHRRAQRYMEKRLLRDLWRAWRDLHGAGQGRDGNQRENARPVLQTV